MRELLRAQERHIPAVLALETECFSRPWSEQSFLFEQKSPDAHFTVCEEDGALAGFCILHRLCDEGELFNLAVAPAFRRRGVASQLLADALSASPALGIRRVYLEVRQSNAAARALYEKHGFCICGVRRRYYDDPKEDALLMEAELSAPADG